MKRKNGILILLGMIMTALCLFGGIACKENEATGGLTLSESELQIEIYDDYQLEALGVSEAEWKSSDASLATVKDGLISAQGKTGTITVTARADGKSGTCKVYIVDSGILPELVSEEVSCFVDAKTAVALPLWYNDNYYYNYTVKSVEIADTSVATFEDGMIKGITVGETTASAVVEWKGCEAETWEDFVIKVYPSLSLFPESSEYTVYDVNGNSAVKTREAEIGATVYKAGVEIENPVLSLRITEGEEYVGLEGRTVTAKSCGDQARQAKVEITYEGSGESVTETVTVNVLPNYVQRENGEFTTASTEAQYALYEGEVGGRTGVYKYVAGENCSNGSTDWVKWGHHLELQSLKTISNVSRYHYMVNECGYALISFDVYYEGQYNETSGVWEYRGISMNALYGVNKSDNVYYVDHVKNVPERLIVNGNEVTNSVQPGTWLTFYVDLRKAFSTGSQIDVFLHSCRVNDSVYVDNIRYWYDDESLSGLDYSGVDLAERTLTQDSAVAAKYAADGKEWMAYSPAFTALTAADGVQRYSMNTPTYENGKILLSEGLQRRIYPVNVYNGTSVKNGFSYLSFEYRLGEGRPVLFAYNLLKESNVGVALTGALDSEQVSVYKDGKSLLEIPAGEWVQVVVRLDVNTSSSDTVYFTSTTAGTAFEIRNMAYWTDDSCKYEFGYNNLLEGEADDVDFAVAGEEIDLRDLVFATWRGKACEFEVESVTFADEGIASYEDGIIRLLGAGNTQCRVTIGYGEGEHYETLTLEITVSAYAKDVLMLGRTEYELYCGDNAGYADRKSAEIEAERLIADGKIVDFTGKLRTDILSGEGVVATDGLTVSAIGKGRAVVKVYYTKEDGTEISEEITVFAHDGNVESEFLLGQGTPTAVYAVAEETVSGRSGVNGFVVTSGNIWDNANKLSVKESDHLGGTFDSPASAAANMQNKGYVFVTFDFCLSQGSSFYLYSPNGKVHAGILVKAGVAYEQKTGISLVKIYDETGKDVSAEALAANVWYTMSVEYNYDKSGGQWSCVQIVAGGVNQKIYLANPVCRYDDSFKDELRLTLPSVVYGGVDKTAELRATLYQAGVEVENYAVAYAVADSSVATCANGKVTFLKEGETEITVTVTYDGRKTERVVKASYLPVTQTAAEAWGLKADSANSFENGVLTLSKDVWNDYLVLREADGRKGTNPDLASASEAVANMAAKNYNVLEFTISVSSGTARVYAPTTGAAQAYVTIGAGTLAYSDANVGSDYVKVYTADGTLLAAGATLTANTQYVIRIYYNTANTGWGEVAIKGAATTATIGGVTFHAN